MIWLAKERDEIQMHPKFTIDTFVWPNLKSFSSRAISLTTLHDASLASTKPLGSTVGAKMV